MKALSVLPDLKARTELEKALSQRNDVTLCRSFSEMPDADTLARALRAWAPSIIFLDIRHPAIDAINARLAADFPEVRRIAIHPAQVPEVFRRVLSLGMRELVNPPFKPAQFDAVMDRVAADLAQNPVRFKSNCRIWAFLPAKAGAGASTIAAHATWAAAENPEERVLLADFDRYSGVTAFQFNAASDYTVQDALLNSQHLDEESWRRLVYSAGNIDLLLSRPGAVDDPGADRYVAPLIQFAQRNYTAIHVDLPDALDPVSLSVLHQADQIFVVATPELPSLRLARLKGDALRKLDLEGRTRFLLNRASNQMGLSTADIATAVGMEVFDAFPSDFLGVSDSLRTARPNAGLVRKAKEMLVKTNESVAAAAAPRKHRFLEKIRLPLGSYLRPNTQAELIR